MTEEVMHPLRRRMLEDMTVRNLSEGTQQVYIRSDRTCCRYCNKKPGELTFEDVRTFRLHLVESTLAPRSVNGAMVGLRFFFRVTLGRPEALDYIPMAREPQRLPTILSQGEVTRLLEAAPGLKWRTALSVAYGAGLRASEVVALKLGDIPSRAHADPGGAGQRAARSGCAALAPAPADAPGLLEDGSTCGVAVPQPAERVRACDAPLAETLAFHVAARRAGIAKPVCLHTLRHCFATHLLEQRVDIRAIQVLVSATRSWSHGCLHPRRRQDPGRDRQSAGPAGVETAAGVMGRAVAPGSGGC